MYIKLIKYWSNTYELSSVVSRSIVHLIEKNPSVGWVRADVIERSSLPKDNTKPNWSEINAQCVVFLTMIPPFPCNHIYTAVSGFEGNLEAAVLFIGLTNALMRFIICAEYQF